jgi:hypothetical protein
MRQEMDTAVCETNANDAYGSPGTYAKVGLPGLFAKFAALDLDGFLPAKILRLFVGKDFLRVSFRLDVFQFCQTITSFSSSIP